MVTLSVVILLHKELPEIMARLSDRENPPAQSNSMAAEICRGHNAALLGLPVM